MECGVVLRTCFLLTWFGRQNLLGTFPIMRKEPVLISKAVAANAFVVEKQRGIGRGQDLTGAYSPRPSNSLSIASVSSFSHIRIKIVLESFLRSKKPQ